MKTKHLLPPLLFVFTAATAMAEDDGKFLELRNYKPHQLSLETLERAIQNKLYLKNRINRNFDEIEIRITSARSSYNPLRWIVSLFPGSDQHFVLNLTAVIDSKSYNFSRCHLSFHAAPKNYGIIAFLGSPLIFSCTSDNDNVEISTIYFKEEDLGLVAEKRII